MLTPKNKKAFTLVELIVVIVILSILATIWFLSFSSQSSTARDSTRMADMSNIIKWLWVFSTIWWTYPMPEKSVNIMSWAIQIWYQWEVWAKTLSIIKFSANAWKDPQNWTYYTYNTNNSRSKMQILWFLENQPSLSYNPMGTLSQSFATDYTARFPYEKWDSLWVIDSDVSCI